MSATTLESVDVEAPSYEQQKQHQDEQDSIGTEELGKAKIVPKFEIDTTVRLSRRISEPPRDRGTVRSKTPIMGQNVPRLARHHSEELLVGLAKSKSPSQSQSKVLVGKEGLLRESRRSSSKLLLAAESGVAATNHHRTASMRRNREKRKKQKKEKQSKNVEKQEFTENTEKTEKMGLMEASKNEELEASKQEKEKEKENEKGNDKKEEDLIEDYKSKFEKLEKEFSLLQTRFQEKENEINQLKQENARLKEKETKRKDTIESSPESLAQDGEGYIYEKRRSKSGNGESNLPASESCVLFGWSLF